MSVVWRPNWVVVEVEYHGMKIRVLRDKVTGLYACPICFKHSQEGKYFFDVPSLIRHMMTHAY